MWTSNLGRAVPGPFGETTLWIGDDVLITPQTAGLAVGTHIITGTATDSDGLIGFGTATVTITEDNTPSTPAPSLTQWGILGLVLVVAAVVGARAGRGVEGWGTKARYD